MVRQFQILQWPNDEEVPATSAMMDLMERVSTWREEGDKGRVIVHCMYVPSFPKYLVPFNLN